METKIDIKAVQNVMVASSDAVPSLNRKLSMKCINLSGDQVVVTSELSGVYCEGVQYYDLQNILFINNTGMANLLDLLKALLKQGVDMQFVNVNEKIKDKIKSLGLENILHCA